MSEVKHIDYVGFTFNNVHSSSLGIVRTSDGSRFNENLLPTIQDKTVQVPGGDGMYHFGSYYTQRQFNISYAFDDLTEEQLSRIKAVFGDKKIHELIFDEAPYKKYYAKVTGQASIKHIPFGEGEHKRIYKGEGSIQFTAYDPYAHVTKKFLEEYQSWKNVSEWSRGACLQPTRTPQGENPFDSLGTVNKTNVIRLYNPGVKETDFVLSFDVTSGNFPGGKIYIQQNNVTTDTLLLDSFRVEQPQSGFVRIKVNTKLNLIEEFYVNPQSDGTEIEEKTGVIYNGYIKEGDFFKIPRSLTDVNWDGIKTLYLILDSSTGLKDYFSKIEYDYLYF